MNLLVQSEFPNTVSRDGVLNYAQVTNHVIQPLEEKKSNLKFSFTKNISFVTMRFRDAIELIRTSATTLKSHTRKKEKKIAAQPIYKDALKTRVCIVPNNRSVRRNEPQAATSI